MAGDATRDYFDPGEIVSHEWLLAARERALNDIVAHAWAHLPFYRRLWTEHGLASAPAAFATLPLTRKRDLVRAAREAGTMEMGIEAFSGEDPRNVVMTTGTMGFNTFAMVTDGDLDGASTLAQSRELWSIGVRPGMRVLSVSPAWHALGLFETRALTRIGAVPVMPWGTLTPRFAADTVDAVERLRPEHLLLTARAVRALLAECDRRSVDSRRVFSSVRYVGCAGEFLSQRFRAYVRDRLELDDLFERGGSGDGMFGGGECVAHRGHHISADVHHVEVVDPVTGAPVPDGRRGTAVVTNLTVGKSVYIRFDTEDVAEVVPGDCPCGRTHPVVEFYARLEDSVVFGSRIVTPADVRVVVDEFDAAAFAGFSIGREGSDGLLVAFGRHDADRLPTAELAAELSEALGIRTTVRSGAPTVETWKEERVSRPEAST